MCLRSPSGGESIEKIYGNLTGLKAGDVKRIERLYRRKIPADRVISNDFARHICEISHDIKRQIGVLISRTGDVAYVICGNRKEILIPSLEGFRSAETRLKGLRLIHTHLDGESLTRDDLTDLALLRLDLVSAIEVTEQGLPGRMHTAHLIPENPGGEYWLFMEPVFPFEMDMNFTEFIRSLEEEFAGRQKLRKVEKSDRAILVHVERGAPLDGENALAELKELAATSGVEVFDSVMRHRDRLDPKYVIGKGALSDIVIRSLQIGANLLVFDHELTPAQIRSVTDFTDMKVIDRTQLILDIFAQRAHSREGKIQVELAQLKYLLPRLVTKNTAMSRLTGGIGGRGPGETKLEINRRRVRERIGRLEKDLVSIRRGREQRRTKRNRRMLPVISIIGYTNAGKSTLLNTLTKSSVLTENRLFATLDPKSSRLRFPRDTEAIITDTVGFIRNLPEELFSAFRATLEELQEADVLLHVIDVTNPNFDGHIEAVEMILDELNLRNKDHIRVFNKEDRFSDKTLLKNLCDRYGALSISALKPETFAPLLEKMEGIIAGKSF